MVVRPRLPGILASQSFTFREGLAAGATLSRLRAKDLQCPSRGIRVPYDAPQTLVERVRPYVHLGQDVCISHVTAALIHGMPLPWFAEDIKTLHLTRQPGMSTPRRKGATGHSMLLSGSEIMTIHGVPVTTPARTFLDLASVLDLDDLVAVADFLICAHNRHFEARKRAIVPEAKLRDYIGEKFHLPGLGRAREAMGLMRVGADSPPETKLRLLLRSAGLPEFVPNHTIYGEPGEYDAYPDLACEKYKVCGEYEGAIHQTTRKQLYDRTRDERAAARGWLQVKVYGADFARGQKHVAAMFAQALAQHGWRPG
ncbi:hypothetical protein [Arthrobacter cryoconiti]|uniref:DUF559 domain-containing protein n=1 Tax=Arthrobacter cryoconiti TaxID=748907 RepID=A0ABV8R452_9MICC|nr:hypothetical protein [Arthrobacter cryoconiti]MCC9067095.1 hypothetical protein [Arthrobacter cryoconiti]